MKSEIQPQMSRIFANQKSAIGVHSRHSRLVFVVLALLAASALNGCKATPLAQVTISREVYTSTLDALSDLREAGKISDTQYRQIELARLSAAVALDAAEAAAVNKDQPAYEIAIKALMSANDTLIRQRLAAEKAKN